MAVELKFTKFDNTPWGFRLIGGSDFDTPLTTIKVTDGSLAEQFGMRIGDTVVRINDTAMAGLTHAQAHDIILKAGNNFVLAVIRGTLQLQNGEGSADTVQGPFETNQEPIDGSADTLNIQIQQTDASTGGTKSAKSGPETGQTDQPPSIVAASENQQTDNEIALISKPDPNLSEDEIAAMISGEAEVLPVSGQQVIGVNFQKFIPNVDFIKESEVFKQLNAEAVETKEEKEKKEKRWTTFLQKPERPTPKPKLQEEPSKVITNYEVTYQGTCEREPPYRVVIKKLKRLKSVDLSNNPPVLAQTSAPEAPPEQPEITEEVERPPTELSGVEGDTDGGQSNISEEKEANEASVVEEGPVHGPIPENELSMEEQLAQVQKQLLALSQLPQAIQLTLDAVTQQLSKIVKPPVVEEEQKEDILEEGEEEITEEEIVENETEEGQTTEAEEIPTIEEEPEPVPTPEPEIILTPEEREKQEKQEKDEELSEEQQRRVKQRPTTSFPLTPLQRPIILPGGRKWRQPDDACPEVTITNGQEMSDELIAETIESQSEIIVGKTLGVSNCPMVPSKAEQSNKINFLKYQAPPKSLDYLQRSEVYKMIHSMDAPQRGVAARPSVVVAEEDIKKIAEPATEPQPLQTDSNLPAQLEP